MSIKLLEIQLEELLKEAIILNDHTREDDLEETYENLQIAMQEINGNLERILKKSSKK